MPARFLTVNCLSAAVLLGLAAAQPAYAASNPDAVRALPVLTEIKTVDERCQVLSPEERSNLSDYVAKAEVVAVATVGAPAAGSVRSAAIASGSGQGCSDSDRSYVRSVYSAAEEASRTAPGPDPVPAPAPAPAPAPIAPAPAPKPAVTATAPVVPVPPPSPPPVPTVKAVPVPAPKPVAVTEATPPKPGFATGIVRREPPAPRVMPQPPAAVPDTGLAAFGYGGDWIGYYRLTLWAYAANRRCRVLDPGSTAQLGALLAAVEKRAYAAAGASAVSSTRLQLRDDLGGASCSRSTAQRIRSAMNAAPGFGLAMP